MSTTKLISVRVDEEDLRVIDEYCAGISYRKRSDVINAGVALAALAIKRGLIKDFIYFNPEYYVCDEFTFKSHRKGCPKFG